MLRVVVQSSGKRLRFVKLDIISKEVCLVCQFYSFIYFVNVKQIHAFLSDHVNWIVTDTRSVKDV